MGIIQKQAINSSIYSYIGIILGFVTTGLLFPNILTTDQNGLLKILLSVSVLAAQFANMGVSGIIIRLFPLFRNKENGHYGFLFYPLIVTLLGVLLCSITFFLFKSNLIQHYQSKSHLLTEYLYYLIPLFFLQALFNILDLYTRSLLNSVIGVIQKEFVQRVFILIIIMIYFLNYIEFKEFIVLYVASNALPPLFITIYLFKEGDLKIKPTFSFLTSSLKKEMINVSFYYFLSGFSTIAVVNIDSIMVNEYLGLSSAGVYGIVFYFGILIMIPSRALMRISYSILAEAWKRNDMQEIATIYKKSCINQFIIGLLLFIGLWANIDVVLSILPEEYMAGKYVIFFVALGNLFDMLTGVNGPILITSRYYKYDSYFLIMLVLLTIITNMIFIPLYKITGAAIATAITLVLYNLLRFLFLYKVLKLQPFTYKILIVLLIGLLVYFVSVLIPSFENKIADILVRGSFIAITFTLSIFLSNASEDFNALLKKYLLKK
jgi:O-antigen/teichoic acid export membrane protein